MKINKKKLVFVIIAMLGVIAIGIGVYLSFNQDEVNNNEDNYIEKRDVCDYTGLYGIEKYMVQSRCHTYKDNLSRIIDVVSNEVNMWNYNFTENEVLIIPIDKINVEREINKKSPFALYNYLYSFVLVTRKYDVTTDTKGTDDTSDDELVYVSLGYNYYVQVLDESGTGTKLALQDAIKIESLSENELLLLPTLEEFPIDELSLPDAILKSLPDYVTRVKLIR